MRLHQVAVPVTELSRAAEFYREMLGVEPIASFDPPGLVFFDLDGVRLMLSRDTQPGATLYLQVSDVAGEVERLRARGVTVLEEAHVIFPDDGGIFGDPGQDEWLAFVADSEGNQLGLAGRKARSTQD